MLLTEAGCQYLYCCKHFNKIISIKYSHFQADPQPLCFLVGETNGVTLLMSGVVDLAAGLGVARRTPGFYAFNLARVG